MHAVGDMGDRHLPGRPARVEVLEDAAADLAVQTADAVDGAAGARGQPGHVEGLLGVRGVAASQRGQLLERNAQPFGIMQTVPGHQFGRVGIEAGGDGGVGGEKVAGARSPQRLPEPGLLLPA